METMTLLKQQLQQPTRNETKFMDSIHSLEYNNHDKLHRLNRTDILRKHIREYTRKSSQSFREDSHSYSPQPSPQPTSTSVNVHDHCVDIKTKVGEIKSMVDDSNSPPSSPKLFRFSPLNHEQVFTTTDQNTEKNSTHSKESQNIRKIELSDFKPYPDQKETNFKLSRFDIHSYQTTTKTGTSSFEDTNNMATLPQDLSKSFPPHHLQYQHHHNHHHHQQSKNQNHHTHNLHHNNREIVSSDGKLQNVSPTSPDSSSSLLLSPLSSSLLSLSSSPSSSAAAAAAITQPTSSMPTIPFRLFSMQPSSLFPISFPTNINISQTSTTPQTNFLENATILPPIHPSSSSSSSSPTSHLHLHPHLPLTPPSPSHPHTHHHHHHLPQPLSSPPLPTNHHNHILLTPKTPKQNGEQQLDPHFLSRKRRHSTAPILVDTSIPFATYLQNLTKTLQASSVRTKSTSFSSSTDLTHSDSSKPITASHILPQEPDSSSNSDDCNSKHFQQQHHHNHYRNTSNKKNKDNDEDDDDYNNKDDNDIGGCDIDRNNTELSEDDNVTVDDSHDIDVRKDSNKNDDDNNDEDEDNDLNENEDEDAEINIMGNDEANDDDDADDCDKSELGDDKDEEEDTLEHSLHSPKQSDSRRRDIHWNYKNALRYRRDRRFKRHRNVSELYIPSEKDEMTHLLLSNEEGREIESRHPLSAPVFAGVTPPIVFPHPLSLFPHYSNYQETQGKSQQLPHLIQQHPHHQQQQQLHQHHQQQQPHHLPRHAHQHHHPHHLPMGLSSIPLHTAHASPPPLLQSQLTPPGSQYSPTSHIYNKLFPGLGTTSSHPSSRFADINASARATVAGATVPGTSSFFTSQFLGLGGLGMRRSSSDKPPPVKKYKCDVCQKAFSRSNTLVTHKRIHTGDKPFKCEICGRAFRQPGNLTRHRLTHTTHKPYVCHVCGKAFNRASNLNTHIRTHNSFRQFGCAVCPKTTYGHSSRSEFNGDRSYKCEICGRCFSHSTTLLAHRRTHAGI